MDSQSTKANPPVMDVKAPPVQPDPAPETPADKSDKPAAKTQPAKPGQLKPAKEGSNVGLAIAATIIIVLGLAGLAVFAYLKQTHSI